VPFEITLVYLLVNSIIKEKKLQFIKYYAVIQRFILYQQM